MRKSDVAFWSFVALSIAAAGTTIFNVSQTRSAVASNSDVYKQLDVFGEVFQRVRTDYVDKPNDGQLVENAINGMLSSLDPHSSYMNAKAFHDMQVWTHGEFGGLGIEVTMENGVVKVVSPIDDTPAAKAGILSGDLITALDGEQVQGLTLEQAVDKMRGAVNSPITLTIVRKGKDQPFDVKVVRETIRVNPVKASAEDDVALIRLSAFNEQTNDSLKKAIVDMRGKIGPRLKGYILDLRNNPGGLLDQAVAVSGDFLEKGAIVITRGRNDQEIERANAHGRDITNGAKLVVLVNGGSASASEIVAGALQDHKRGVIVGTRSFGKGSVQTIIPLGANGALRLTTARYYTPANRSIQAKGIDPDYSVEEDVPDDIKSLDKPRGEASLRGHLKNNGENSPQDSGSSAYVPDDKSKDKQLIYALNLLRGVEQATTGAPATTGAKDRSGDSTGTPGSSTIPK
jgi:carboxyl-terminal processing protease